MTNSGRAWGVGIATVAPNDEVLDVFFRRLGWGERGPEEHLDSLPQAHTDPHRGVGLVPVNIAIDTDIAPKDAADAYLRLHLLSHRFALPNSMNLDGIFALLANVAWTSIGAVPVEFVDEVAYSMRRNGKHLTVHGVDKFSADDRSCRAIWSEDCRRLASSPRCAPCVWHNRDARRFLQLQCRHTWHLNGRGSDLVRSCRG